MAIKSTFAILGLVAGSTLALSAIPAQAASFGNGGIKFDQDTMVDFGFISSQGAFKSTLSIVEAANKNAPVWDLFTETKAFDTTTPDFMGTCPKTVSNSQDGVSCGNWFTFKGGVDYSLLLDSGVNNPGGTNGKVYSTDSLNTPVSNQAKFSFTPTPAPGKYTIKFDDGQFVCRRVADSGGERE